jgi:TolB-like protein
MLTLVLLVLAVRTVAAQDVPVIAVLPFESLEVPAALAQTVTELFESGLADSGRYTVLSGSERERVLNAQEPSLAECAEPACAIRAGHLLGADQVLLGSLAALGGKLVINAKIIAVATSRTVAADSVSTRSADGLEEASGRLTASLLAAVPTRLAAAAREPSPAGRGGDGGSDGSGQGPDGAGVAAGEDSPTGVEAVPPGSAEDVQPDGRGRRRTPKLSRRPAAAMAGRPAFLPYLSLPGALVAADLGNVARSVGFELQLTSVEAYADYSAAVGGEFGSLYGSYEQAYGAYLFNQILAYSFWGIGGASAAAAYFLFPPETYAVSRWGRVSFHAGMSLLAAGSVLSMVADNLAYRDRELYADYLSASAGDDLSALYDAYSTNHAWYGVCRITSYSLWALGGLGVAGSFFLPGDRETLAPARLNRLLLAGGTAAILLGGVTHSVAQSLRPRVEEAEQSYLVASAGSDFDALYRDYKRLYGWYGASSVLSYVLWGGGASAVVTSLFVRSRGGDDGAAGDRVRQRPESLLLVPTPNGLYVRVALPPTRGGRNETDQIARSDSRRGAHRCACRM